MIITKARMIVIALTAAVSVAVGAMPLANTASAKPKGPATPKPSALSKQTMCNALWSEFSSNVELETENLEAGDLADANVASNAAAKDMTALREYGCIA
jgi:hypothetical protein